MTTLRATINPSEIIRLSRINEGDEIGYLGCGSGGYFAEPLSQVVGATGRVYAVDILPEALTAIQRLATAKNLTNLETVWSNLEVFGAAKITSHSLDAVFLITMIYQNKNKEAVLKEVDRLIKKNGTLSIIEWLPESKGFGPANELRVAPGTLISLVTALGYELRDSIDVSDYHYCLIFQKL